jgi:hypothetical protein
MPLTRYCLLVLTALAVPGFDGVRLADAVAGAVLSQPSGASRCEPAPAGASATRPKPSSFAPHARSRKRVYGAPIQRPILASRTRHRRHTEKRASP